jgi:hypothetical protein
MARFIFGDEAQFRQWLEVHALPQRNEIYITSRGEVIVYPTKTSRPLNFAYIQVPSESLEWYRKLASQGFRVFEVEKVQWDDQKEITQVPIE